MKPKSKSADMSKLLIEALEKTVCVFKAASDSMPVDRWNESVFRFFFCQAIAQLDSDIEQFVECRRIDLVLHGKREKAFIEFKFYTHSWGCDPYTGDGKYRKGFPGRANRKQFEDAIVKLRERKHEPSLLKIMVLFYADPKNCETSTYHCYYRNIKDEENLKIKKISSIESFDSGINVCHAAIYEVLP